MGLSRICFYSLFIFISGLNDRRDDMVTEPAADRGGSCFKPSGLQDCGSG